MSGVVRSLATAVAATLILAPAASAADPPDKLGAADLNRIERAERAGDATVTLLVAAKRDRIADAAADLRGLGGQVVERNARVDYLQVRVPTERAAQAGKLRSVTAVDVDGLVALDDPRPDAAESPQPQTPPSASTPRINPYLPTTDTKAAEFVAKHPSWDGRGTRIAVIDTGIDLDNPALQTTSTGERKVVDWFNANATNSGDGTWVEVDGSYTGAFSAAGRQWTAPATGGPYAFGVFRETAGDLNLANSETGGDVNRDGDRTDEFGVLQDTATKEVRVDVDQDGDFTDEAPMIDYKVKYDVGHFGTDDPSTAVAERIPFVVDTHNDGYVGIGMAAAAHGSHVAGIVAGNALFGGQMAGAAPGAKLIAVKACLSTPSCTSSGLIDGVLYAAKAGADAANISIGGLPGLNDGNNARAELYDRTIDEYGMQLFISAGNSGPGENTVGDPSVATDALSIAASITNKTYRANYGSVTKVGWQIMPFSSRGPREDGGFKPQLSAPGSAISTIPLWQNGGPVAGTFALPPGYAMFNGTSMAAPQAAGAAAVLISAYKATFGGAVPANGPRPDPEALRSALVDTATFVSGFGAYEQGAGEVNVLAAWPRLADKPAPRTISAQVPVSTALSDQLTPPGIGTGIHDREGVAQGQQYTRTYTLRRTSGPAGNETYAVTWKGDTAAFTSAKRVVLPLGQDVQFPVTVKTTKAGVSSAILRLDTKATKGVDLTTLNTVVAAAQLTPANGYSTSLSGQLARNEVKRLFVRVPEAASALTVRLDGGGAGLGAGQIRFLRFSPYGVPFDSTASTNCYDPDAGAGCALGDPHERTVADPVAGVWEITVEARRTSDTNAAPFTVTASIGGAQVSPDPDTIPSAQAGVPVARDYTATNLFGAFTGRMTGGPLSSVLLSRPTIANGAQQEHQVTVPAGATRLSGRIGNPSDSSADIDLLLYDCTSGSCVLAGSSAGGTAEEAVSVANPAAGLWSFVVDGYAVPAGTTDFDYEDAIDAPFYGTVSVSDANAERSSGATWTVPGVVTAKSAPGAGRILRGAVRVVTEGGIELGRNAVLVQSVS